MIETTPRFSLPNAHPSSHLLPQSPFLLDFMVLDFLEFVHALARVEIDQFEFKEKFEEKWTLIRDRARAIIQEYKER